MQKKCSKCKFIYVNAEDFFYKVPRLKSGLSSWCKKCQLSSNAEFAKTEDGKNKAYARNKKYREKSKSIEKPALSTRICSLCNENKEISFFKVRPANKDGYANYCKKCEYLQTAKSRQDYRVKKWAYLLIKDAQRHSNNSIHIDENFVLELFEKQQGRCYWFNIELKPSCIAKYPWQPSLDRLDREIGYTKDNVVLACYTANIGRNITSKEMFRDFVEDLKNNINEK